MRRILLIDDEKVLNESLSDVMQALGHEVTSYFSIKEAHKSDFSRFDVIICDVGLPGECAFTFVRWVKEHYSQLPVVMLSAFSEDEKVREAMKAGAHRYLVKPAELSELRKVFDSLE